MLDSAVSSYLYEIQRATPQSEREREKQDCVTRVLMVCVCVCVCVLAYKIYTTFACVSLLYAYLTAGGITGVYLGLSARLWGEEAPTTDF